MQTHTHTHTPSPLLRLRATSLAEGVFSFLPLRPWHPNTFPLPSSLPSHASVSSEAASDSHVKGGIQLACCAPVCYAWKHTQKKVTYSHDKKPIKKKEVGVGGAISLAAELKMNIIIFQFFALQQPQPSASIVIFLPPPHSGHQIEFAL